MRNGLRSGRARGGRGGGFTLIECAVGAVLVGMIAMTIAPVIHEARSQMRGQSSAANLMAIGQGGGMYAQDNQGRMFSYSWRAGETYMVADGRARTPSDDTFAATYQNEDLLQRLTGRISGVYKIQYSPLLPHRRYQHLILIDYLDQGLGDAQYIDPSDKNQLDWAAHPLEYDAGSGVPYADGDAGSGYDNDQNWTQRVVRQRWPFASSYQPVPSSWQFEAGHVRYVPLEETPHLFRLEPYQGDVDLHTGRSFNEVRFPGNKVWFFEEFDREAGDTPYFAYNHARPSKLMFDGSVDERITGDAMPSMVPENGYYFWTQTYVPLDTFPLPIDGLGSDFEMNHRYRWTTLGLAGFDYGPPDPAPRPARIFRR